jgi:hypothetical protein
VDAIDGQGADDGCSVWRTGGVDASGGSAAGALGGGTCASAETGAVAAAAAADGRATTIGAAGGASWMRGVCCGSGPVAGTGTSFWSGTGRIAAAAPGEVVGALAASRLFSSSLRAW